MPVQVTDEDLTLLWDALKEANLISGTEDGSGAKNSRRERLRVILQALLDGKSLDVGTPGDLTDDQALELFKHAVNEHHIEVTVESNYETIDHMSMYGMSVPYKMVTKNNSSVTAKFYTYQITGFMNYIKNKLWG
jgi:hypothetical protein